MLLYLIFSTGIAALIFLLFILLYRHRRNREIEVGEITNVAYFITEIKMSRDTAR